jgi:hypothetical protein
VEATDIAQPFLHPELIDEKALLSAVKYHTMASSTMLVVVMLLLSFTLTLAPGVSPGSHLITTQ